MKRKMYKLSLILLLIACQLMGNIHAQELQRSLVTDEKVLVAGLDRLHQIYYINTKRQIKKLVPAQNREFMHTDLFIDSETVLNVQNAFRTMLYKKDVGTLVILDARLRETGRLNLFDLGYFDVSAISFANDNQSIWLFDRAGQHLVRLDQQYNQVFISPVMPQQLGFDLNPVYITETESRVYVVDETRGVFIFDNIGNYFKKLPIEGVRKVWVFGPRLLYYYKDKIWEYNLMLMDKKPLMNLEGYKNVYISREFILARTENGELYRVEWPRKPK